MELTASLRREIQAKRESLGFSSLYLAEKLGVCRTTLRRWERGETTRISAVHFRRLQEFLEGASLEAERQRKHPVVSRLQQLHESLPHPLRNRLYKELKEAICETLVSNRDDGNR